MDTKSVAAMYTSARTPPMLYRLHPVHLGLKRRVMGGANSSKKLPSNTFLDKPHHVRLRKTSPCASMEEGAVEEKKMEVREESRAEPSEASTSGPQPPLPPPSPFASGKISSRIATRPSKTNEATNVAPKPAPSSASLPPFSPFIKASSTQRGGGGSSTSFQTTPFTKAQGPSSSPSPSPSPSSSSSSVMNNASSPFIKAPPSSIPPPPGGREMLKNAKPSAFADSGTWRKGPGLDLLDAIKKADQEGKTTKFGQPIVPTNLFDEPLRTAGDDKTFEFSFNRGQIFIVISFLTITSLMFGTAFLVWKVGAIHFNEY